MKSFPGKAAPRPLLRFHETRLESVLLMPKKYHLADVPKSAGMIAERLTAEWLIRSFRQPVTFWAW